MALSRTAQNWPVRGPLATKGTSQQFDEANYGAEVTGPPSGAQIIKPNGGSATKYLRWQENACTGMALEKGTKFLTGPFSGCCFFMALDGKKVIILHANDNQHRGDATATQKEQKKLAEEYLKNFHRGAKLAYHVSYQTMGGKFGWIEGEKVDAKTWNIYYAITEENTGGNAARRLVGGAFIA